MKKIYILLVSLLPLAGMAQPTISQSDLPAAGIGWLAGNNNSYAGAIPAGGNNTTWDYSSLVNSIYDTTAFLPVTGTPYVGIFTTATCAAHATSNGYWGYYTGNSTGFYYNGGNTSYGVLVFSSGWLYVPVPFTYNDNRQNVTRAVVDTTIGGVNYRDIYNITSNFVADGWGSLVIPSGTFPNVLRVKDTYVSIDSVLYDPLNTGSYIFLVVAAKSQTVTYRYLQNNASTPVLLEIDADSAGTTATKSSYLITGFTVGVNDQQISDHSLSLYPNPASDLVHINLEGKDFHSAEMTVYNSIGQEIMNKEVKEESFMDIAVDRWASGIYYYSLFSDGDKRSGKFSVMH